MPGEAAQRLHSLDLVRGLAVLGILAINIAGFAAPAGALHSPDLPHPGSWLDHLAFNAGLILFEGKMRALFSLLFGASLLLFVERADQAGRDGMALQLRRLGWLTLFGLLHFALLWDGDILFLYAVFGLFALGLRQLKPASLIVMALLLSSVWQLWGTAMWAPSLAREQIVMRGAASPDQQREQARLIAEYRKDDARQTVLALRPWRGEVSARLAERSSLPIDVVLYNWGETLPLMLLGMALLKTGFFAGQWPRPLLLRLAAWGLGAGGLATLAFALWGQAWGWPEMAMRYAATFGMALPRAGMALGYAALLIMAAPRVSSWRIGQRLEAAGRTAFSNYLGTSLVMCALFDGWGLALYGQYGAAGRWLFVLLGWAMMLAWSKPWLERFRQGPLEWLWRSLTAGRLVAFRNAG